MIKIMITIVYLLLSVTSFAQSESKNYLVSEILQVDIRGVGCHGGSGLCSVVPKNGKENTYNLFIAKESFNSILLIIDASKLNAEEQSNYFGKDFSKITSGDNLLFTQDVDFVFDEKSLISLGLESKYNTIKKGSYPCEMIKNTVQVKMNLSEN
jgi:hypothetical protein